MEVSINAEDLPELEEGRFYVADLIGLPVYDEQGEQIGTFKDALSTGSNDVYVIAVPGQKDYLLPALKKYVKEINLAEKRIVVELSLIHISQEHASRPTLTAFIPNPRRMRRWGITQRR